MSIVKKEMILFGDFSFYQMIFEFKFLFCS